jgi:hypothetical protein
MKHSFALVGAAAQLALGLVAPAPSQTNAALDDVDLYGVSPKPTAYPLHHPDLAKRQTGQTLLGYVRYSNIYPSSVSQKLTITRPDQTTPVAM